MIGTSKKITDNWFLGSQALPGSLHTYQACQPLTILYMGGSNDRYPAYASTPTLKQLARAVTCGHMEETYIHMPSHVTCWQRRYAIRDAEKGPTIANRHLTARLRGNNMW